jgi:hypothetical protein
MNTGYPRSAIAVSAQKKLRQYKDFPRHYWAINNVIDSRRYKEEAIVWAINNV